MMKKFFCICLMSLALHAYAGHEPYEEQSAKSRWVMPSCEFIYQVETDFVIKPSSELFEIFAGAPLYLKGHFLNSWIKGPVRSETFLYPVDDNRSVMATEKTMSSSDSYLYREFRFSWVVYNTEKELVSVSDEFSVDLGRDFGEPCSTRRHSELEYFPKAIKKAPR